MATQSLVHRMKLKTGHRAAFIDAPGGYLKELAPLPDEVDYTHLCQRDLVCIRSSTVPIRRSAIIITFEFAPPGKPEAFTRYIDANARRKK